MTKRAAPASSNKNGRKRAAVDTSHSSKNLSSLSQSLARQADDMLARNGSLSVTEIIRRAQALSNSPPPTASQPGQSEAHLRFQAPPQPLKFVSSQGDPIQSHFTGATAHTQSTSNTTSSFPSSSASRPPPSVWSSQDLRINAASTGMNQASFIPTAPTATQSQNGRPYGDPSFAEPDEPLLLSTDSARIAALIAQKRAENAARGHTAKYIEAQRAHQSLGKPTQQFVADPGVGEPSGLKQLPSHQDAPATKTHKANLTPFQPQTKLAGRSQHLPRPTHPLSTEGLTPPENAVFTTRQNTHAIANDSHNDSRTRTSNASDAEGEADDDGTHDSLFSSPSPLAVTPLSTSSAILNSSRMEARDTARLNALASQQNADLLTPAATPIPPLFSTRPPQIPIHQQVPRLASVPFGPSPAQPSPPKTLLLRQQQPAPKLPNVPNVLFGPSPPGSSYPTPSSGIQQPTLAGYKMKFRLPSQPPVTSTAPGFWSSSFEIGTPTNAPSVGFIRAGDLTGIAPSTGYNPWAYQNLTVHPWKNSTLDTMYSDKRMQKGSFALNKHCN